jgi:hypothetical protein
LGPLYPLKLGIADVPLDCAGILFVVGLIVAVV